MAKDLGEGKQWSKKASNDITHDITCSVLV